MAPPRLGCDHHRGSRTLLSASEEINKKSSLLQMSKSNEDLARIHLETALALTSRAFVDALLLQKQQQQQVEPKSTRGRKPGAAPLETRCAWNVGMESHCKNNRKGENSYCQIHLGKVHLIDDGV